MEANKRALRCAELSPQSTNFFGRMQTLMGLGMGQKWFWSLPIKTYSFCFLYVLYVDELLMIRLKQPLNKYERAMIQFRPVKKSCLTQHLTLKNTSKLNPVCNWGHSALF